MDSQQLWTVCVHTSGSKNQPLINTVVIIIKIGFDPFPIVFLPIIACQYTDTVFAREETVGE